MADIFISYARVSQRQAEMFEKALSGLGYSVWRDTAALPIHRPYQPEIEANLRAARAVLVLWSKEAAASDWVRAEADLARGEQKLLQVTVDGGLPPMPFNQTQCADFSHWRGDTSSPAWAKLISGLSALLASEPPAPIVTKRRWRPRLGRRSVAMAVAVAVLAAAGGTWLALGMPGWPQAGEGVAVTPFDTTPGDASARSFADGVADEIASTLARVDMKSRLTEPGLSGPQRDAAAARLGAAFSLGGRVRRDGDALHVTLALADARRHDVLWSSEFTRPAAEAEALQAQVANEVGGVLHCTVDAGNFGGRIPPESLSLYLRACDAVGTEGPDKVRDLFQQVVAREPGFANAWADLAMVTALGAGDMPPELAAAARRDARTEADRALRLDPKAGMAYAAYDLILAPGHFEERQNLLLKGLSVSPNNAVLVSSESALLDEVGRIDESIVFSRKAALLDPLHIDGAAYLAGALATAGQLTEARKLIDQTARLWPDLSSDTRVTVEARWGDPGRAIALLDDPKSRPSSWEAPMIAKWRRFSVIRRDHDPAETAAFAKEVLANLAAGRTDLNRAVRDLVGVGATEAAFSLALRSTPADPLDTEVLFLPTADGMRRDPRFMPLAAKLGLVAFWKRTNHWPDFCEAKNRPYDCRAVAAKLAG